MSTNYLENLTESDLTKIIGLTVDITILNDTLTGMIFTIDKQANLLVLLTKSKEENNLTSMFINTTQIQSMSLSKNQIQIEFEPLMKIDMGKICSNEKSNLSKDDLIKKAAIEPNFEKGLNIYEALSKMYKCTYEGKRIILDDLDAYIEAPFHLINLHCEEEDAKKRLTKIIAAALKKKA